MATNPPTINGIKHDKPPTTCQSVQKKEKINTRLVPIKIYYFLHEGGGAISPFVTLVAKRIGISVGVIGIINTVTVSLALISKPLVGGLVDKFGWQKLVWLFCHLITVICIFALIFIPPVYNGSGDDIRINATLNCTNDSSLEICIDETLQDNFFLCQCERYNQTFYLKFANNCQTANEICNTSIKYQNDCVLTCSTMRMSLEFADLYGTYQFWCLSIGNIVAGVAKRLVEVIQTSVIYGILGGKHSLFGKQKIFGSLGYGLSFIVGGILNQYLPNDSEGFQYNYSFYIFGGSMLLASIAICWFKVEVQPRPKQIVHDVRSVFAKPQNCFIFVSIFFMGTFVSFLSTYSFWYLSDLGASPLVLGLAKGCQALIGEIPCLFTSGSLIKKLGHFNVFSLIFVIQTFGFCIYALMDNVMFAFLTEILNGIIIGFFLPTATSYCTLIAPPGTGTTLQGIFFAVFKGAGRMVGNLGGGLMYSAFGGRTTYLMFGVVSFICCLFNITLNLVSHHRKIGSFNIS